MNKKALLYGLIVLSLLISAAPAGAKGVQPPLLPTPYHSPGPRPTAPLNWDGVPLLTGGVTAPATDEMSTQGVAIGPSGTYFRWLSRFGITDEPFLADGQHLDNPLGIHVVGTDLFVTEEIGDRVLKFNLADPTPTDPPTASQIFGHAGMGWSHDDFLNAPRAITTDLSGNIWVVAESYVKEFDSAGNLIQTIPPTNPWESGSDDYHFQRPLGITFGPGGYLYVADTNNHRTQIYDVLGTASYVATIGVTGEQRSDNTGFSYPFQMAVDSSNRLYVMDGGNARVQRCASPGGPYTLWACSTFFGVTGEEGIDLTHLKRWAIGITIDTSGASDLVYLGDGVNARVLKCSTAGLCSLFAGQSGVPGNDDTHFSWVGGVAVDGDGNVYVSDSDNDRVQVFNSAGVYQDTYGVTGQPYLTAAPRLFAPWGVAVAADGSLYVKEYWGERLVKFNAAGAQQWTVGQPGVEGGDNSHFWRQNEGNPAVDASGRVYVSDMGNNRVQIYNSDGSYFATLGSGGQGNYQFSCPGGIAISPVNGDIYVTDQCNQRIQVFTSARVYKATIGQTGHWGPDNWSFNVPRGVAVDALGNIYVADSDNDRVQKCTLTGPCTTFVGTEGMGGNVPNGANVSDFSHLHPVSVTLDGKGRVYVVDDWSQRVLVYDAAGAYLASIGGSWGSGDGQLVGPRGVAVDKQGNVYVTDMDNHRVEKYAPGYSGWTQANVNGFGNVANLGIWSMAVFNGQLYAGTQNAHNGAEVWRSTNGTTWLPFSFPSWGSEIAVSMQVFGDKLYVGTSRGGGGEIWRTDGAGWEQVVWDGMGDGNNFSFNALASYAGWLYAATSTNDGVMKVYRSANGTNWDPVVGDGLGSGYVAQNVSMQVHGGKLYVGLARDTGSGLIAELWMTDGNNWTPVFIDGLGNADNNHVPAMAEFNGTLYIGLRNLNSGGEVWKYTNDTSFEPVFTGGLGNADNQRPYALTVLNHSLYVVFYNEATGAQVWRTWDGTTWHPVVGDGWGDVSNAGAAYFNKSAVVFNGKLYLGMITPNPNGAKIWRFNNPPVSVALSSDGSLDGCILEKTKGSGTGGTLCPVAAPTFQLGDSPANQQYRAVLSFNTFGAVPPGATITKAVLKIKPSGAATGVNPFTILGSLYADVRKGFFGASQSLLLDDFKAPVSAAKVGTFGKTPKSGWYTATLTATGRSNINTAATGDGLTQFRLYFSLPTNSNGKADSMPFISGDGTPASRPQLVITFIP